MNLHLYKYKLPFKKPLLTSKQRFKNRVGFILSYEHEGNVFYGEAAPLPSFSSETPNDAVQTFQKFKNELEPLVCETGRVERLNDFFDSEAIPPSLQFALDTMAYQITASEVNQSLKFYLHESITDSININALFSLNDTLDLSSLRSVIDDGYSTIKCKVGIDFEREIQALRKIRAAFPQITIRVDANQSWPLEEAITNCNELAAVDIQYCEEPLAINSRQNYQALAEGTNLPLALDESIYQSRRWTDLMSLTSFIIVKPMVLGSFNNVFETKRLADAHDNQIVCTTALESGFGRIVTAILTSAIGSKNVAHGLGTGDLLAHDLISDSAYISNGKYHIPEIATIRPDLSNCEKIF